MSARRAPPSGSPPHAWGRLYLPRIWVIIARFTPTCVGKTIGMSGQSCSWSVHPHMRGEDSTSRPNGMRLIGSPPHAWGRRSLHGLVGRSGRFTPTCVGKTSAVIAMALSEHGSPPHAWGRRYGGAIRSCLTAVHPHMRGEDLWGCLRRRRPRGSPPHAWGRRLLVLALLVWLRFTPTCVGKT